MFVPKFSISSTYDLGTILLKMGIQDAFADNADFSELTEDNGLKLSKVSWWTRASECVIWKVQ